MGVNREPAASTTSGEKTLLLILAKDREMVENQIDVDQEGVAIRGKLVSSREERLHLKYRRSRCNVFLH